MNTLSLPDALTIVGRGDLCKVASDTQEYSFSTRESTFVSTLNAFIKGASAQEIAECKKYARFWGVLDDCHQAAVKVAAWVKEHSQPTPVDPKIYALRQEFNGQPICKYAAFDASSTEDAAIAFYTNRNRYPFEWRTQAATNLLKRAQDYNVDLPEAINVYLHKAAGLGYASQQSAEAIIEQRIANAPRKGFDEERLKLASLLDTIADNDELLYDSAFLKKTASIIGQYDELTGLVDGYGKHITLPEEIMDSRLTTCALEKVANCGSYAVTLVNGKTLEVHRLDKNALSAVDDQLGSMSLDKLASVLPTLPRDDADLLCKLVNQ